MGKKKHSVLKVVLGILVFLIVLGALGSGGDKTEATKAPEPAPEEEVAEEPDARIEGVDGKVGKASDKDTEVLFEFRWDRPSILAEANSFVETRFVAVEFEVEVSPGRSELEYLDEIGGKFDGESKITKTDDNTSAILALLCLQHSLAAGKTTSDNTDLVALGEHDGSR